MESVSVSKGEPRGFLIYVSCCSGFGIVIPLLDHKHRLHLDCDQSDLQRQHGEIYATEGIKAACDWAYKNVRNLDLETGLLTSNSDFADPCFLSRLPIVNLRLAQGGVRLAATLNRMYIRIDTDLFVVSWENYEVITTVFSIHSRVIGFANRYQNKLPL